MKVYPKIPRYDHPVVPPDLFAAPDLALLEKVDGSSFRFTLYEDRFNKTYPKRVVEAADGDGSVVFGTRRTVRGSHRDPLATIDGALHRVVRCLREGIDTDVLRTVHDELDGPVIVYAENLIYSTLDYGFTDGELPALVGFDVLPYRAIETMTAPGNPYEETFDGFLDLSAACELFERLRVSDAATEHAFVKAPVLDRPDTFDPMAYDFPASTFAADTQVEGVVLRSDSIARRAKLVRDSFQELNREQFGRALAEAESGAEYVVATYCTPARIRKQVRHLVVEEGRGFGLHLNDELYPRVVEDIWAEHWPELMDLDVAFTPADVYPLVAKRCIRELRKMETNAELNDADPTEIWRHLSE